MHLPSRVIKPGVWVYHADRKSLAELGYVLLSATSLEPQRRKGVSWWGRKMYP
jgi:hypothetical protein